MNAKTRDLNTRPRPTPALAESLMSANFDLVSLILAPSQFQDLLEYLSLAQDFVHREQQEFKKRIDNYITVNALHGEDREEYYSSREDDYGQLQSRFPRIVFSSTLLMACALFEGSLVDLCKAFDRALPTSTKWVDLPKKDKGIKKAANFLKVNFGIHLSNYSHWNKVTDYFTVRACIVHADGDLRNMQPNQATQIRNILRPYGSLASPNTEDGQPVMAKRLVIEHDFVSDTIKHLGGVWPLLETACIQNEVVGPHYWP